MSFLPRPAVLGSALAALLLGACNAPETETPPVERDVSEPRVRPDINAGYLDPQLDVEMLATSFASESREAFAAREAVTAALPIGEGSVVADVGVGTGIYTEPFSEAVGETGLVYAVDISQPLLDYVEAMAQERGLRNVRTVLGGEVSTTLPPSSVDLVFTSDVYHHFERPRAMNAHLFEVVRPGGAYAILDFHKDGAAPGWIKRHVRSDMATVIEEVTAAGFRFRGEVPLRELDENYLLLFEKPAS